jgi:hypothetical protein
MMIRRLLSGGGGGLDGGGDWNLDGDFDDIDIDE